MATFTAQQVTDLATVFDVSSYLMDYHLDRVTANITDSDKASILEYAEKYLALDDRHEKFTPVGENKGLNSSPSVQRDFYRRKMAGLLAWTDASSGQERLYRA